MTFYAKEDECFVELTCDEMRLKERNWEIVALPEAIKQNVPMVKCAHCEKPAYRLDQYFPYHKEMNSCQNHLEDWKGRRNKMATEFAEAAHTFCQAIGAFIEAQGMMSENVQREQNSYSPMYGEKSFDIVLTKWGIKPDEKNVELARAQAMDILAGQK